MKRIQTLLKPWRDSITKVEYRENGKSVTCINIPKQTFSTKRLKYNFLMNNNLSKRKPKPSYTKIIQEKTTALMMFEIYKVNKIYKIGEGKIRNESLPNLRENSRRRILNKHIRLTVFK